MTMSMSVPYTKSWTSWVFSQKPELHFILESSAQQTTGSCPGLPFSVAESRPYSPPSATVKQRSLTAPSTPHKQEERRWLLPPIPPLDVSLAPRCAFTQTVPAVTFPRSSNKSTGCLPTSPQGSSSTSGSRSKSSKSHRRKLFKRASINTFYKTLNGKLHEVSLKDESTVLKEIPMFTNPPNPRTETAPVLSHSSSPPRHKRRFTTALSFTALRAVRNCTRRKTSNEQVESRLNEKWLPPMRTVSPFGDAVDLISQTWSPLLITDSSGSNTSNSSLFPPSPSTSNSDHALPTRTKSGRWTIGVPDDDEHDVQFRQEIPSPFPPLIQPYIARRDAAVSVRRRCTLAAAMTDEGISDEVIVAELEHALERSGLAGSESTSSPEGRNSKNEIRSEADVYGGPSVWLRDQESNDPELFLTQPTTSASWTVARCALLICRDLIRTERHYLNSLRLLLAGNATRSAPPPLMLPYARALVDASSKFLETLEDDPSAWGVATAFCRSSHALEAAFVSWCGVVGGWFTGSETVVEDEFLKRGRKKRISHSGATTPKHNAPSAWDHADASTELSRERSRKRGSSLTRVSAWRRSLPQIAGLASVPQLPPASTLEGQKSSEGHGVAVEPKRARGLPNVRDLAILPTQRVMRYVLLYQDLLAHTPASSQSHALVQQAVDTSILITQKCDRAQGNAAFFMKRK